MVAPVVNFDMSDLEPISKKFNSALNLIQYEISALGTGDPNDVSLQGLL